MQKESTLRASVWLKDQFIFLLEEDLHVEGRLSLWPAGCTARVNRTRIFICELGRDFHRTAV